MNQYESLRNQLKAAPFLAADVATGKVRLVTKEEALRLMDGTGLFDSQVIMNAGRALENFVQLIGKDERTFSLRDIAKMTGSPYSQAHFWVDKKVIKPSIQHIGKAGKGQDMIFSWTDGFIAGICGAFRHQGVGLELLSQVKTLFTENNQAAQQHATAGRS